MNLLPLFLRKQRFFYFFTMHVDYICSFYNFLFCREKRHSFHVHSQSKSLKKTLDRVNFSTKNTELFGRHFLKILFLELIIVVLQNDKFDKQQLL